MKVEFIEPVAIELDDAIEFYNQQSQGLGNKFFDEILKTIDLILHYAEIWSKNSENTRKAVLNKFPYHLIYALHDDKLYIIAVAHQHREPEYWIDRKRE